MGKRKLGNNIIRIFGAALMMGSFFAGSTQHHRRQPNTASVEGGFPSVLIEKVAYSAAQDKAGGSAGETSTSYMYVPSAELLSGLESETLRAEFQLFRKDSKQLQEYCMSNGLIDEDEKLSPEELSRMAAEIYDWLKSYYSQEKDMPGINYRLEEQNGSISGLYNPLLNQLTLYKPQDAPELVITLAHEISHAWIRDETLNTLSTDEILAGLAEGNADDYIKEHTDTLSGRDACLYGLALERSLIQLWKNTSIYLRAPENFFPDDPNSSIVLSYYVMPCLIMRYSAANDSVTNPVLMLSNGESIDLSATQSILEKLIQRERQESLFPFD